MREEDEKRRREKSKPCTLSFYNGYFRDYCWTEKVQLAVTFSKIRLDVKIYIFFLLQKILKA